MPMPAHGSPFELDAVGIVEQTIQDGISGGGIARSIARWRSSLFHLYGGHSHRWLTDD